MASVPEKLFLTLPRAPGDTIALTALLRDLRSEYPDIQLGTSATGFDQLLTHNPHLSLLDASAPGVRPVRLNYRTDIAAARLGLPVAFLSCFHRDIERQLTLPVPLTLPRPELHLTTEEVQKRPASQRYWVIVAGGKQDMPVKIWSSRRYQEVVDRTRAWGVRWAQVGLPADVRADHIHFPLTGVTDLIGKTSLRELMQLVYHADGVLCGPTQTMLMAQAFERPCVVIAGGRESYTWIAYTPDNPAWGPLVRHINIPHRVLSAVGKLDCCRQVGCWACQVIPPHQDSPFPEGYLCTRPTQDDKQHLPECMASITTDEVVAAIHSYYADGTLPPL